ncbi:ATP-binding protein [Methanoplanus endosymbiosus]|uniref:ATP-binding protein n=1 Tax=Methanoplanus endosymbiosus TaxID=33865 RepID=A0A9E7PNW9_9EURY|nr:ATP-binding protein [Methanoplanus endosymbiosus]UUX93740.1 ATP-binding protein [Methanoplanus endosymbiosus]
MGIDLSGVLSTELKKNVEEYKKARSKNDIGECRDNAHACAVLCYQIAEQQPAFRDKYIANAKKWENIATGKITPSSGSHNKNSSSGPVAVKGSEKNSGNSSEIDFDASSLIETSSVTWNDIGGLDEVKRLVKETVVIAGLKKPDAIKPWKGILLFGPPGTGKTMIAAAAAGSLHATFFNVKSDRVLSKYFGESSKLISSLYETAKVKAPSIIFIDEFDALGSARGEGTSEASRKVLSSLLIELDGLQNKKSDHLLLSMAATNTPWDLDTAVLSRFPRRIFVTLPDEISCRSIIQINTVGLDTSGLDLPGLGRRCVEKLYSGRDIQNLCQQAIWNMIHDKNPRMDELADLPFNELKNRVLNTRELINSDFEESFERIHSPLNNDDLKQYNTWNDEYGERSQC